MSEKFPASNQPRFNQEKKVTPELMLTPAVEIIDERGPLMASILMNDFSHSDLSSHELGRETKQYLSEHPFSQKEQSLWGQIQAMEIDEEAVYFLSLILDHDERRFVIIDYLKKHKSAVTQLVAAEEIINKLLSSIRIHYAPLLSRFDSAIADDIELRRAQLPQIQNRIQSLVRFFRPQRETSDVRTIKLLPTNFLVRADSGRAFNLGREQVIMSHIDNSSNLEHEFLHSLINPLVEKFVERLEQSGKSKIVAMADPSLRIGYGENGDSLLAEELIRTYVDYFARGYRPGSLDFLRKQVNGLTAEAFDQIRHSGNEEFLWQLVVMGIDSLGDFQAKADEFYEQFLKSEKSQSRYILKHRFYDLYEAYDSRLDKEETFEHFFQSHFDDIVLAG